MQAPLANPNELEEDLWYPLDGTKPTGPTATGPLWLESDTLETDYILLETDVGGTDYIELEAT